MTRRPLFWIVFAALGIAGAVAAIRLFSVAMPSISLDVRMDRGEAIAQAGAIAERLGWAPADARSAASFGQVSPEVQTYVELEGGGRDAFQGLVDAGVYHAYQWQVRRFAEGLVEEAEVRFAPDGTPYGFRLRFAESAPGGGNLDRDAARAVAEREVAEWPVELENYSLLEASEQTRPGGRVDHRLVFERSDVTVGDARVRLRLVVAGNALSELTHFVFVPEEFSRRYADMRSTNDTIALVSQSFFILVYVLLGAGIGTALLLRERWVEWRAPMLWGAVVAVLFGLNNLNSLPLAWMGYDTALSARTFVFQSVAAAVAIVVLGTPLLGFFFMAAESLGRRAFPNHVQQWRFWAPEVAASRSALGLTIAAYLLVGIQVGYVVFFYLGTSRLDGWWSPANALVQPDLLATYQPWLQAVAISLFASLWEESIFRAVPIACAALIGARYGRRHLWVWGAVLLQAVVFAAGHANYPQQPAYARVVELTFPALGWGIVYVFFGLVPTILAHFLYDLALISSVLFASDAPVDQLAILAVAAVPLAIVLGARVRIRGVDRIPEWAYNGAWRPREREDPAGLAAADATGGGDSVPDPDVTSAGPSASMAATASGADERDEGWAAAWAWSVPRTRWATLAIGAVGLVLWTLATMVRTESPRLEPTRIEAVAIAGEELSRRGLAPGDRTVLVQAGGGRGVAHEYVFEEAGAEAMVELEGSFLAPPQWIVRFVDWNAEPADRVEEFVVNIAADGSVRRVAHTLPEGRPGASLSQDSARVLARGALPPGSWEEVGAEEATRDSRTDWDFTFRDPTALATVAGEGRAALSVLGDEVTNLRQFVDVPEEWERARRESASRLSMIGIGLTFVLVLLFGACAIAAIFVWSRGRLVTTPFWPIVAVTGTAMTLAMANSWPSTVAGFVTSQPYGFQVGGVGFGLGLVVIVSAAALGLVASLSRTWSEDAPGGLPPVAGVALGFLLAGLSRVASSAAGGVPGLPDYGGAAAYLPSLVAPLDVVPPFLLMAAALAVLSAAHRRFRGHPVLRGVTTFAILAIGIVLVPETLRESLPLWVATGLAGAALVAALVLVLGRNPRLTSPMVATVIALGALEVGLANPYSGARLGALLACVVVALLAVGWSGWGDPFGRLPESWSAGRFASESRPRGEP